MTLLTSGDFLVEFQKESDRTWATVAASAVAAVGAASSIFAGLPDKR